MEMLNLTTPAQSAGRMFCSALLLFAAFAGFPPAQGADAKDGVALAIVYDTSGSMLQQVRDVGDKLSPKYVIAARALNAVLDRLQAATKEADSNRLSIQAALVVFQGDHARLAVKMRPFDPVPFREWLKVQGQPQRGTPLGDAVRMAAQTVLDSNLPRKHVLVITDGVNTQGPDPTATLPNLQREARRKATPLAVHFVAFDVNAGVFEGVKKMGVTVVGAADEKQLTSQLEFIIEKKILLEDEEPVKPKQN